MESYTSLFIAFLGGIIFHSLWNYLVNSGYTIMMMKAAIRDCIIVTAKNMQSAYEINYIKEEAWRLADKDEKYIEFQKTVDKKELMSLQNTIIRNFVNSVPPKYDHLVEFHDWDSAMKYIDKVIKEGK